MQNLFLAAKEQIHICNAVLDEEICYQYLLKKERYFTSILQETKTNFNLLKKWMENHSHLEWIEPTGGLICFPRFKNEIGLEVDKFYKILLEDYKTYVGPGHWFEQSKRNFRLGFGWEKQKSFEKGLKNIGKAIANTIEF